MYGNKHVFIYNYGNMIAKILFNVINTQYIIIIIVRFKYFDYSVALNFIFLIIYMHIYQSTYQLPILFILMIFTSARK